MGIPIKNIKLTIEYDGTNYHGWQSQINAVAIQDVVQKAIEKLTNESCTLLGSSRTDVGVHALGMAANFTTNSNIPAERFSYALNSVLPFDIVIKKSEEMSPDFHSRRSATGKKYKYLIYNSAQPSALLRDRVFHFPRTLNLQNMQKAASFFLGRHDFSAFRASGSSVKSSERTITDISISKKKDVIELEISGDGFLYKMVRIIAGTIVEVGEGKITSEAVADIIESRDRKKAGKTAPAQGLYLVEVYY